MKSHTPLAINSHGLQCVLQDHASRLCQPCAPLHRRAAARDYTSGDKGNGYVWFRGADSKLWVCWWGGSSYLAGPLTAADCAGPSLSIQSRITAV